jgi:hypothetical protein
MGASDRGAAVPRRRPAGRDIVLVRKVQWDPLESVPLSTRRYLEAAAAAMASRLRRDEVGGQEPVGLVEDHDEAQDPSRRISGIDRGNEATAPVGSWLEKAGSRLRSLSSASVPSPNDQEWRESTDRKPRRSSRSRAPPPRIVIPTTPAAMRWFRRLGSPRRSVRSTVLSVFPFTYPVTPGFSQHP